VLDAMALSEQQRLRGALLLAALAHGGVAWFALRAEGPRPASSYVDAPAEDWLFLDDAVVGALPAVPPPELAAGEANSPRPAGRASAGQRVAALDRSSRPQPNGRASEEDAAPGAGAGASEPVAPSSSETSDPAGAATADGPELSLDALGVGKNPFAPRFDPDAPLKPRRSSEGFRRSMAQSITKRDQALGLGPEGPILKHLEREIRQSETPPNSKARFRARIDRTGKLVTFELLEASTDHRPWRELAERVLAELAATELRVPKTGRGLVLDMSIESRVALPSGADPGLAIDVLGIPLKKGGGERSHRLSLLHIDPGGREIKVKGPGGVTLHIPEPPKLNIFSLGFDPVDIGANVQRVVHARVDGLWAEDLPDAEAPRLDPGPAPATTSSTKGEPN
jgi:hypothetical protein